MGKRMLAPCFDCSDFAEKIRFINATARGHRDEVRLTHGESTRLVDHQRVDLFERLQSLGVANENAVLGALAGRSEEHTSELQSLMRISYAVFCLKKKNKHIISTYNTHLTLILT